MSSWLFGSGEMAARIRAQDWAATPLGQIETWPESLRITINNMLSVPQAMMLAWGPELTMLYNDAYAPRLGDRHPLALGRSLPDAWPDVWPDIASLVEQVFAGEAVRFTDKPLISTRNGFPENTWWTFSLSPLWNGAGEVAGVLNVTVETTYQVLAERERDEAHVRLRESEQRFRAFVTASSDVVYRMSPNWSQMRQLDGRGFLADTVVPSEDWVEAYILLEDRAGVLEAIEAAIRDKRMFELEHRVRRADGDVGWTFSRAVPILTADGTIAEWLGSATDVTVRKEAEAALRESEERQAFLLKLSDALRPLADPVAMQKIASQATAEYLDIGRVTYCEVRYEPDVIVIIERDWPRRGMPPVSAGRYRMDDFGPFQTEQLTAGHPAIVADATSDPRLLQDERENWRALDIVSSCAVPVMKEGRLVAYLAGQDNRRRDWTDHDVALLREVSERTWAAVERARAEAAVRESEARLAAAFESVPLGVAVIMLDGSAVISNAEYRRFLPSNVIPSRDPALTTRWRAWDAEGRPLTTQQFPGARAIHGETVVPGQEMLHTREDGREVWTSVATAPTRDESGRVTGAVTAISNIDAAKRGAEALRESEERLRQFGEASSDVLWIRSAETFQWEYLTPAFETIYGIDRTAALSGDNMANWIDLIEPEDRERAVESLGRVHRGERVSFEYRIRRPIDGAIRWLRNTDFPMRDAAGEVHRIGGVGRDITDEKETADRMQVLLAELQHRTRNLMGVVSSMANKTMARSADLADFRGRFGDRLNALARVQGLLSRLEEWDRVTFDELIRSEMSALDGEAERVELDGPMGVALRSSTVQTFSLALHELMTNALKYGALAQSQGRLSISWRVERAETDGRPWLHVDWRESNVTMPADATARVGGSGRELITRALPYQLKARTTYVMAEDGVHCTIALPVSERSTSAVVAHA